LVAPGCTRGGRSAGSLDELIECYPNVFCGEQVSLGSGFGIKHAVHFNRQFTSDMPRTFSADAPEERSGLIGDPAVDRMLDPDNGVPMNPGGGMGSLLGRLERQMFAHANIRGISAEMYNFIDYADYHGRVHDGGRKSGPSLELLDVAEGRSATALEHGDCSSL
jgi:hypothetical protein